MKREVEKPRGEHEKGAFPDNDWMDDYPIVCEYLVDSTFDDGTARQLSAVHIKWQDDLVLVSLSDAEMRRGLYRTGQSVPEALAALEKALASGKPDWRPWKDAGKKGGR